MRNPIQAVIKYMPGSDTLFFSLVFGSEEFPTFVGGNFSDGFGIILNGTNVAAVAGSPINIDHPDFVDSTIVPNAAGTELNGILSDDGGVGNDLIIDFQIFIGNAATNNTITFILADVADSALDTTVYISSLGGTPAVPPPPAPPLPTHHCLRRHHPLLLHLQLC
jgi:hypothetical protein